MSRDLHHLIKSTYHAHGRNPDVDTAASEDIWPRTTDWTPPTAARTHDIVSTSASDDAAGTGARTVQIYGIGSDWALANETVNMAGTSDRVTIAKYHRIHKMIVRTVGSDSASVGTITATANTDATVTNVITAGLNQSTSAIMTTPSDAPARLVDLWATNNSVAAIGETALWVRPEGEPWQIWFGVHSYGEYSQEFTVPLHIPAKADVKLRATTPANNNQFDGGFTLVFRNDLDLGETD